MRVFKKLMSLVVILAISVNVFSGVVMAANTDESIASVSITRNISPSDYELYIGEYATETEGGMTLTYTFQPDPITYTAIETTEDTEIVLVIDKSGSMGYYKVDQDTDVTRLDAAKSSAVSFVESLKGNDNIIVSLVTYNEYATIYEDEFNNNNQKINMGTSDDNNSNDPVDRLINAINDIQDSGSTNIGDGIRRAYELLAPFDNEDNYLIFLTDGEPRAFSVDDMTYTSNGDMHHGDRDQDSIIGWCQEYDGFWYDDVTGIDSVTYDSGIGMLDKYFWYESPYGDSYNDGNVVIDTYALDYAKEMASMFPDENTSNFLGYYIAFGDSFNVNVLEDIANAGGNTYLSTTSSDGLSDIYKGIADQINARYQLTDVYFEDTIPEAFTIAGLTVNGEVCEDLSNNGQVITGNLGDVLYTLNEEETHYVADPITFTVTLSATAAGDYILGADGATRLSYYDLDGTTLNEKVFDAIPVSVINKDGNGPYFKDIEITSSLSTANLGDTVTIEYSLIGNEINYANEKDVLILFDTSLSMKKDMAGNNSGVETEDKRITIAKEALTGFVDYFADEEVDMNVGLITFDYDAQVHDFGNSTFLSVLDSEDVTALNAEINGAVIAGGTNTGDAFRQAYYEFINRENTNDKYIVCLTDGEPWCYRGTETDNEEETILEGYDYEITNRAGRYNYTVNVNEEEPVDYRYVLEEGDNIGTVIVNNVYSAFDLSYSEYLADSHDYVLETVDQIANSSLGVRTFIVGMSSEGVDETRLEETAVSAGALVVNEETGAHYYVGDNPDEIAGIYDDIKASIVSEYYLKDIAFSQVAPEGLTLTKDYDGNYILPEGYIYDESTRTITGTIDSIRLVLQDNGLYLPEDTSVEIDYTFESTQEEGQSRKTTNDITIDKETVTISYITQDNETETATNSEGAFIKLMPKSPNIKSIAEDNFIANNETSDVRVVGTTDPNTPVTVILIDETGVIVSTKATTSNNDGDYVTSHNITPYGSESYTAKATVIDGEGDKSESSKHADLVEYTYFGDIGVSASPSSITSADIVEVNYTLSGSEFSEVSLTEPSYTITVNQVEIRVPSGSGLEVVEASLPTGFTATTDVDTGDITISGSTTALLKNTAGNSYQIEDKTISIIYKPTSFKDAEIPEDSVTIGYYDIAGNSFICTDGNLEDIDVRPCPPTINEIAGDDIITIEEDDAVVITGTAEAANMVVTITVTEVNNTDHSFATSATTDGSGNYETPALDLSGFAHGPFIVEGVVTDDEGDISDKGTREGEILKFDANLI